METGDTIGFIGLGNMGAPMAGRLLDAGLLAWSSTTRARPRPGRCGRAARRGPRRPRRWRRPPRP